MDNNDNTSNNDFNDEIKNKFKNFINEKIKIIEGAQIIDIEKVEKKLFF